MSWSWRLGRIAGIDVYIHFTFLLLLAWVGLEYYLPHRDLAEALAGLVFILALFGIVVLHELGHALAVRRHRHAIRQVNGRDGTGPPLVFTGASSSDGYSRANTSPGNGTKRT